ncbi:MAG: hypothetical protein V1874_16745 [Spirochaetota bacterium]
MIRTEQTKRNPLRILEHSSRGELGKGNIGVIAARKGVGKTACLVHIATDELFNNKHIIHVSFAANTGHIISWYEDIFEEIAKKFNIESAMDVHDQIVKNRIIMNFNQDGVKINQITNSIKSLIKDGHFSADSIIVDGYDFHKCTVDDLKVIRNFAAELGLEIWFSVSLKDNEIVPDGKGVPDLLTAFINEISIIIYMKPVKDYINLQLVKDHEILPVHDMHLKLDPLSLLIVETE